VEYFRQKKIKTGSGLHLDTTGLHLDTTGLHLDTNGLHLNSALAYQNIRVIWQKNFVTTASRAWSTTHYYYPSWKKNVPIRNLPVGGRLQLPYQHYEFGAKFLHRNKVEIRNLPVAGRLQLFIQLPYQHYDYGAKLLHGSKVEIRNLPVAGRLQLPYPTQRLRGAKLLHGSKVETLDFKLVQISLIVKVCKTKHGQNAGKKESIHTGSLCRQTTTTIPAVQNCFMLTKQHDFGGI